MPVTILDGPDNKDCCFFCGAIADKQEEGFSLCVSNQIDDTKYFVEILLRYCPRCGKELIPEQKYHEIWNKRYKNDYRLFTINSEIATFELIKAMDNSRKKYLDKVTNDS